MRCSVKHNLEYKQTRKNSSLLSLLSIAGNVFNLLHKNSSIFFKLALLYAKHSASRFFLIIHLLSIWNLNYTLYYKKTNQLALNLF